MIRSIELRSLKKSFGTKVVNDGINFSLNSGEILGFLGENGAGKTTLMNMLYGLYTPDEGKILINNKEVKIRNPREAQKLGIGMVHQHFMLVPSMTVLENISLADTKAPFLYPQKSCKERIQKLEATFRLDVPLNEAVWNLAAGQLQRVEIVKALINGAGLLILDEPTSVLSPQEAEQLFMTLRNLASQGMIIIIISHKLHEILAVCSRVLVLQKGKITGDRPTAGADSTELARMMIGRVIVETQDKREAKIGECILSVNNIEVKGDRGHSVVENLSLQVHQHQIVGIAGVSGNGQRELAEAITGLRNLSQGNILLDGVDVSNKPVKHLSARGLAHIPEERMRFGIVPNLLLYENAVLKDYHTSDFSDEFFINYKTVHKHADMLVENYRVATPGINTPLKHLSGGNIQKLILGREISGDPTLLVASHPTYGLDVGATAYIRDELLRRREAGGAILLLSEDLDELLYLSDIIHVMFKGRILGSLERNSFDPTALGLMMTGVAP